jgi:hypothetical protein
VRACVYRGEAGYSLTGREGVWPVRIFARSLEAIEDIRALYRAGTATPERVDHILRTKG